MGLIARVLSFVHSVKDGINFSDVTVDPDGGSNLTAPHFSDSGDDASPLPDDSAITTEVPSSGRQAVVGYIDTENAPKTAPGEKRIYGRDPATGQPVNEVWLKNDSSVLISNALGLIELKADGEIELSNAVGSIVLNPDGSVTINGATITALGDVISAAGKSLSLHVHPGVTSGPSSTGPPV